MTGTRPGPRVDCAHENAVCSAPHTALARLARACGLVLCLDVDGTIADPRGAVFGAAAELIATAGAHGDPVCLCSARSTRSLRRMAEQLQDVTYLSGFGGLDIQQRGPVPATWQVIAQGARIGASAFLRLLASFEGAQCGVWAYTPELWLVDEMTPIVMREASLTTEVPQPTTRDAMAQSAPLKIVVPRVDRIDRASLETLAIELGLAVEETAPNQVDIRTNSVDDKGLSAVAELNQSRLPVAVGNGPNDRGLLAAAGVGVTFADAVQTIRAGADIVLPRDRSAAFWILRTMLYGVDAG